VAGRIVVGTSSWADPGFVERWYPPNLAARDRLAWYAARFEAVEVNSTFYAVPELRTVQRWAEVTPDGFTFDVKLHRLLSRHSATLDSLPPELREEAHTSGRDRVVLEAGLEGSLADAVLESVQPLVRAGKLSAFLLQLSPSFSPRAHALEELDALLERLRPHRVAVELRNRNWTAEERLEGVLRWMEEREAAWVGVDAPRAEHFTIMPPVDAVTRPDLAYLRMHGRNAEGYIGGRSVAERFGWRYTDAELEEVLGRARALAEDAEEVRVMANNNEGDLAPTAARRMRQLLGQDPGPPPPEAQLALG
jgi:uncharacterized protein YecE (DUF72 family)